MGKGEIQLNEIVVFFGREGDGYACINEHFRDGYIRTWFPDFSRPTVDNFATIGLDKAIMQARIKDVPITMVNFDQLRAVSKVRRDLKSWFLFNW